MSVKCRLLCQVAALAALSHTAYGQDAVPPAGSTAPDTSVPAASQSAVQQAGPDDAIVVTGLRRSLQTTEAIRRNSLALVDSIVAEDIGKLPDLNVSESLARIVGVGIDRASGEGGQVRVRGLANFTTTYNGREIFTAEQRNVATQDFGSGNVAALEVYKTTSPEQVEGGIVGIINVRSRRPFDFKGLEVSGSANAVYEDQPRAGDYNGNLLVSNRWQTGAGEFGALINVSMTQSHYLEGARFDDGSIRATNAVGAANSNVSGFRYPDGVGIFYNSGERWRPSVNTALQWKPSNELLVYFDGLYQGFRRHVSDRQIFVPLTFDPGAAAAQNRTDTVFFSSEATNGAKNQLQSTVVNGARRPEFFQGGTEEQTDTYQFGGGATYTGERFKVTVDLAHTESRFDLSVLSVDSNLRTPAGQLPRTGPTVNVNFDVPREDGGVEFSFPGYNLNDPNNYIFRGLFDRHLVAKGDDIQFRTDIEFDTHFDFIPKLVGGFRYTDRNAAFGDVSRYSYQEPNQIALSNIGATLQPIPPGFQGSSTQPLRSWLEPTFTSIRGNVDKLRTLVGFPTGAPPFSYNFVANEHSWGGYGKLLYAFSLGQIKVHGEGGVRAIITDTRYSARVPYASYTDLLPTFDGIIELTPKVQVHGAFTQTRTRPDFSGLAPITFTNQLVIDPLTGLQIYSAFGGNPNLQPVRSDNYDLGLEYYFSRTGFATATVFRRDITGFFTNVAVGVTDPTTGHFARPVIPFNGGVGRIDGAEVQARTFFDFPFVPHWAQGFGIEANYTYLDGNQAFPNAFAGTTLTGSARIPNVSKHTYNLVGFYEAGKLSARIAYNHRSDFITGYDNAAAGVLSGSRTAAIARLDGSVNYTPVRNLTVSADVSNILGDPFRDYRNYTSAGDSFPTDVRFESRIYSLGIRFRY